MMQKSWKMTETLAYGFSYESIRQELSNEYQHDRVQMVSKKLCVLMLWTKVASALEGLSEVTCISIFVRLCVRSKVQMQKGLTR